MRSKNNATDRNSRISRPVIEESFRASILMIIAHVPPLMLQQWLGISNWHAKVRTAESAYDRKRHSNHTPILVHQRSARSSGRRLRVVNNLVGGNVTDVPLRHERPNQLSLAQFGHYQLRVAAAHFQYLVDGFIACSPHTCADRCPVAQRNQ